MWRLHWWLNAITEAFLFLPCCVSPLKLHRNWFGKYLHTSSDRNSHKEQLFYYKPPDHTLSSAFLRNRTLAVAHPLVVTGTRHNCEQAAPVCAPIRVIKETRLQPVQTGRIIPQFLLPQLFLFYWQWGTESKVRRKCGLSLQKWKSSSFLVVFHLLVLSFLFLSPPTLFSGSSGSELKLLSLLICCAFVSP